MSQNRSFKLNGFTFIELLIVVVLIAILAAIAVPGFNESSKRSNVSSVKSDLRTVSTALESYWVDHNAYPVKMFNSNSPGYGDLGHFSALSTPVAFIASTAIPDIFSPMDGKEVMDPNNPNLHSGSNLRYMNVKISRANKGWAVGTTSWVVYSFGPDKVRGPFPDNEFSTNSEVNYRGTETKDPSEIGGGYFATSMYDATNGARLGGDISKWSDVAI